MTTRSTSHLLAAFAVGALTLVVPGAHARAEVTCVPTVDAPVVEIEPGPVQAGAAVRVAGAGWCHPTDGGSVVALKIDEGAYSRVDAALHPNRTIWALVDADPADGTFSLDVQLPDGTEATSVPAFPAGTHTVRALSGSLKDGDQGRTVLSNPFVVGEHRPQGIPDAVGTDQLRPGTRQGLRATLSGKRLSLTVPGGRAGEWVFVSLLASDGSPRYPWGATWHRLAKGGKLTLGAGESPVEGPHRVVVQSGELAAQGALLGWARVNYRVSAPPETPGDTGDTGDAGDEVPSPAPAPAPAPTSTVPSSPPVAAAAPPLATGALTAPVGRWSALRASDRLSARLLDGLLHVRAGVPEARLFVHAFDRSSSVEAGWVTSDQHGRVRLDLASLPVGTYRFTLQEESGDVVGWVEADLTDLTDDAVEEPGDELAVVPAGASAPEAATVDSQIVTERDGWLAGVGAALLIGLVAGRIRPRGKNA